MDVLSQQIQFIQELDKLKAIYRQTLISADGNRRENSAEHSWHITLMMQILAPYANPGVDLSRVAMMLLIHDIVEIDAGDTFAFASEEALDAQAEKEIQAAKRLFGLLPSEQCDQYLSLWYEFEAAQSPDAQFAKSMDRLAPLIQNMHNQGGSWPKFGVTRSQALKRNQLLQHSAPELWQYVLEQVDLAVEKGWLKSD